MLPDDDRADVPGPVWLEFTAEDDPADDASDEARELSELSLCELSSDVRTNDEDCSVSETIPPAPCCSGSSQRSSSGGSGQSVRGSSGPNSIENCGT